MGHGVSSRGACQWHATMTRISGFRSTVAGAGRHRIKIQTGQRTCPGGQPLLLDTYASIIELRKLSNLSTHQAQFHVLSRIVAKHYTGLSSCCWQHVSQPVLVNDFFFFWKTIMHMQTGTSYKYADCRRKQGRLKQR